MNTSPLGPISVDEFLTQYWQKKPLFVSKALADFGSPLSAEELAGLACEEEVESRIVQQLPQAPFWNCHYGPFAETDFEKLPSSHWTLLVQECNKYHPDLAALLDLFAFIPNWRVDDIMVSFAVPGGSVGPHLDQYDVFLIQAYGKRRWQINSQSYYSNDFIPDIDLQILKSFNAEQEWLVQTGDLLYLPPGVAHYGVATEDCITISVGFRAPSYSDLLSSFTENLIENMGTTQLRYTDPDLTLQENNGLLTPQTMEKIRNILQQQFAQTDHLGSWFGRFATEPKNEPLPPLELAYTRESFLEAIQQNKLCRSEYSRFCYTESPPVLFVDGQQYPLDPDQLDLARLLCSQRQYDGKQLEPFVILGNTLDQLLILTNQAKLILDDDSELSNPYCSVE